MLDVAVIKFAKTNPNAKIPQRVEGSAGMDIYACFDEDRFIIKSHETKLVPTGLKSAIDENHFMLIEERGSTGSKGIKRSAGVVDADYRGEIFVAITNSTNKDLIIAKDIDKEDLKDEFVYPYTKAIAQAIILPTPRLDVEELTEEELNMIPSLRGEGKLGSSGK